jgi:uncharacterized protein (DUF2384 family)
LDAHATPFLLNQGVLSAFRIAVEMSTSNPPGPLTRWVQSHSILLLEHFLLSFLPTPAITLALLAQLIAHLLNRSFVPSKLVTMYLPRLPAEVFEHVAAFLVNQKDLVRFSYASVATYHAANMHLYKRIVLEEHPSPNIPWFRRRLHRLAKCLTAENAAMVRHLDVSSHADINDKLLLSILKKCSKLTTLSLPAIQVPIQSHLERRGVLKQPIFLSERLCVPVYSSVTSLTWTGPFIPFRGAFEYTGRSALQLFLNLRSLKIVYRPDSFSTGDSARCYNTYAPTVAGVGSLWEDLQCLCDSCPLLEEITLPFWEAVFSMQASWKKFRLLAHLRKVEFRAVDTPVKDIENGRGLIRFMCEMDRLGIKVHFSNPWRTNFDIAAVFAELRSTEPFDAVFRFSRSTELLIGPVGPLGNPWQLRQLDILQKLQWVFVPDEFHERLITLRWPINISPSPAFEIPTMFTGVEFLFNTASRARRDASRFLEFTRLVGRVVEMTSVERLRVQMECVDAFYLAFPLFMQFEGNRKLSLRIDRMAIGEIGEECVLVKRQWKILQGSGVEEDVTLKGLAEYAIHVHPARLFEKIMLELMFQGQRKINHVTAVFHDRYFRR